MAKRNILAAIIPALLAASSVNAAEVYNKEGKKLELYGTADARHLFSDSSKSNGDDTYLNFGLKGETQITDSLTGYGQWEYNVQGNRAESQGAEGNATRLAFAGLKFGDNSSFDYGRNYGLLYDIGAWTDVLPIFGGDSFSNNDNFFTRRGNGMATYRNPNFFGLVDGLNVALQYQGKNERDGRHKYKGNGDGWAVSSSYDVGSGISVGGAYSSSDRTDAQVTDNKGKKAQAWTLGTKYDANNLYLAAIYGETLNQTPYNTFGVEPGTTGTEKKDYQTVANKTQNIELVARYQLDFGLRPSLAYVHSQGKDLLAHGVFTGGSADLVKYVAVGTSYAFNKNISTYMDYKINLLDDNTFTKANHIATDDILGVGLAYQF